MPNNKMQKTGALDSFFFSTPCPLLILSVGHLKKRMYHLWTFRGHDLDADNG
jgi:hypothetical protein